MSRHAPGGLLWAAVVAAGLGLSISAQAQEYREPEGTPLPARARVMSPYDELGLAARLGQVRNGLPNIMLVGYWPPSNEMLRRFSPNPSQNPEGWIGENWEGRGYNIYAFFPEFPQGLGKGEGDFEVDYQDTSADFWPITAMVAPIAMITFGRGQMNNSWEVERRQRNLAEDQWVDDYLEPLKPTPAPPEQSKPAGYVRYSTLPTAAIATAVNSAGLGINAYVDTTGFCGAFLCEYLAYHGVWYNDLHWSPTDPQWNVAAGHIHVGGLLTIEQATAATEISLRVLIDTVDVLRIIPGDLNCDGLVGFGDINPFVLRLTNPETYFQVYPGCPNLNGDIDGDGEVGFGDINPFVALLLGS